MLDAKITLRQILQEANTYYYQMTDMRCQYIHRHSAINPKGKWGGWGRIVRDC